MNNFAYHGAHKLYKYTAILARIMHLKRKKANISPFLASVCPETPRLNLALHQPE
jgi:hypothetical protein